MKKIFVPIIGGLAIWPLTIFLLDDVMGQGSLEPPPGPITNTMPSLADLEAHLDAIEAKVDALVNAAQSNVAPPYEVLVLDTETSHATAEKILSGRVFLHSVSAIQSDLFLFDGPGTATNVNWMRHLTGDLITHVDSIGSNTHSSQVLDVVVENGLYMSNFQLVGSTNDYVIITYKPLP